MRIEATLFRDLYIIYPQIFNDDRGYFLETFNEKVFKEETGLKVNFVQDNESKSKRGVLRGLHYQEGVSAQSKLVRAVEGTVLDTVVDMREDSDTFGRSYSIILDDKEKTQLFVPKGFAHGFLTLSEKSRFAYKCDNYYNPKSEGSIDALDPTLNINWVIPHDEIIRSEKDKGAMTFIKAMEKKVI